MDGLVTGAFPRNPRGQLRRRNRKKTHPMPCGVGLSRASGSKSFGVIVCSSGNVENAGQLSVVVPELCKTDNLRSEERSLKGSYVVTLGTKRGDSWRRSDIPYGVTPGGWDQ